ncbi:NADH-quinone oxidoreductase subunit NuoN [Silvimonas iriomotensis]|uniref:NADH-quinone oxidoreductase subunit N n=1 Tax=Silvimonas iriomotensis TaxID=449662 RepID=A0ABQ2PD93_9NEIS|nr:NADH-quinone oxidoreductase subunit NuoN [Silvimonas iriomotensis]GGP23301.1 NADH-quinone oxidoreductase subunit N [Silvimonas iriomotensis]
MTWTSLNAWAAAPEIFLLVAVSVILLIDLFVTDAKRHITYLLTLVSLAITACLTVNGLAQPVQLAFSGMFVADPIAGVAKLGMVLGVALVLIYGRTYAEARGIYKGELFSLTLFALLGMMVMSSALNFVTLYVGLELLSLSLYALVALRRDNVHATEAAMKYFILGALASGMLLYGMSMVYGATHSLDILTIAQRVMNGEVNHLLIVFGIVFIVVGIGFKLGAVPFHMWVPDVYEGSPTLIAQLIGSAPKIAAFAFVIRILAQGLEAYVQDWRGMLVVMAILSLAIGNLTAIAQTNIKRMFAYSTISHMGFLLLGVLVGTPVGYAAAFFYAVTYMLTTAAGFGVVMLLSREGFEADRIDDFKGLNQRSPWFAAMMLLVMFSMAGIPVFVGFFAKLAVLEAVVNLGLTWLAIYSVLMSVIGAFYYLRVVKVMYFDEAEDKSPIVAGLDSRVVLSVNCLLLLVIGLMPDRLLYVISAAVAHSLLPA